MRRLFTMLTALGLFGAALGCHHWAGKCDCDPGDDPCCYFPGAHSAATPEPVYGHGVGYGAAPAYGPGAGATSSYSAEPIAAPTPKSTGK
jgi:hypothetical protein